MSEPRTREPNEPDSQNRSGNRDQEFHITRFCLLPEYKRCRTIESANSKGSVSEAN